MSASPGIWSLFLSLLFRVCTERWVTYMYWAISLEVKFRNIIAQNWISVLMISGYFSNRASANSGYTSLKRGRKAVSLFRAYSRSSSNKICITFSVASFCATENSLPEGGFVSIERTDGLRIGSLEITAAGQYSLTFYPDYILSVTDEVIFTYTSTANGNKYQAKTTLGNIFSGNTGLAMTQI